MSGKLKMTVAYYNRDEEGWIVARVLGVRGAIRHGRTTAGNFGRSATSNVEQEMSARSPLMLGAALLVAATAACGGSGEVDDGTTQEVRADAPIVAIAASEVETKIVGGAPEQQAALREILAGIGPTGIERIEVGKPEPGREPVGEDDVAVSFALEGGPKNLRGEWEAWLVAGVFRDVSDTAGFPAVLVVDTNGDAVRLDRRVPAEPPPPPPATPEAAQELAERVRRAAAESGAELVDLSILEPAGLAFAVTLKTNDPAKFLKEELDPFLELFDDRIDRYEGAYIRVIDEAGEMVWHAANASRMTRGSHGVTRPELRGCDPISIFPAEPEDVSPPCPA
ncbi:MAG: hypothetical protein ACRDNC_00065 [Gaiellaceae bacterium]